MSKTWILPVAGFVALLIAVVAVVARFTSRSLEPPAPAAPPPMAAPAAPPPVSSPAPIPVPSIAPSPPPARKEVNLDELESFKALAATPFPSKAEWDGYVAKADSVAREQLEKSGVFSEPIDLTPLKEMEKQGVPATAAMRATLQARKKKAQEDYDTFTKKVEDVFKSWGDRVPEVPQDATSALARDLVTLRSQLQYLDERLSRLQ